MNSNYDNLNLVAMTSKQQWVLWKNVVRNGKPSKVPFTLTGKPARVNDPITWSTYDECARSVNGYEGIGFVFTEGDPFVGIDLDGCRDPESGVIADWAQKVINLAESYTEVSPSGTGIKIFLQGEWPHGGQKRNLDEPRVSNKMPGIEVYSTSRYFTITGDRISERADDAEERQEPLDWLFKTYFADGRPVVRTDVNTSVDARGDEAQVVERARKYIEKMPPAISGEGGHNSTFRVACVLMIGFGLREEDAMPILQEYNQRCQPAWTERELLHKLQHAARQPGPRNSLRHSVSNAVDRSVTPPLVGSVGGTTEFQVADMKSVVEDYIDDLSTNGEDPKAPTGINSLDRALGGGFSFGDFVVLGGLSSHLKSGIAQQIGHYITRNVGLPFGFISLEMSTRTLAVRTLQFASALPRERWADSTDHLRRDAQKHFQDAASFQAIQTMADHFTVLRAVQQLFENGVKVIAVDYLQLVTAGSGDSQYLPLGNLAGNLKRLATLYDGIVIGLAQLRKDLEKARPMIPRSSHIEHGSRIVQTADVCLLGLWPHKIDPKKPEDLYQFYVTKNRNGNSGTCVKCKIEPARLRIMEGRSQVQIGERISQLNRPDLGSVLTRSKGVFESRVVS